MTVIPIEILLVEDNPADVRLTAEALKEAKVANHLTVRNDGVEAVEYLRGQLAADAPLPDLVLLDLNLPRKDGREVLAEVKGDRQLRHVPVVILTSSDAERDILEAYELQANCYITKPVELEKFLDVVAAIDGFWFSVVKLPKRR